MAINYKEVRNDRQWKASTGLSEEQFFTLVKMFGEAYERLCCMNPERMRVAGYDGK